MSGRRGAWPCAPTRYCFDTLCRGNSRVALGVLEKVKGAERYLLLAPFVDVQRRMGAYAACKESATITSSRSMPVSVNSFPTPTS